jgi:hypothetical protein
MSLSGNSSKAPLVSSHLLLSSGDNSGNVSHDETGDDSAKHDEGPSINNNVKAR